MLTLAFFQHVIVNRVNDRPMPVNLFAPSIMHNTVFQLILVRRVFGLVTNKPQKLNGRLL